MKKDKDRLSNILEQDRLNVSKEINSLICYDLTNLLENYFSLSGATCLNVEPQQNNYLITITATATNVKSFKNLK